MKLLLFLSLSLSYSTALINLPITAQYNQLYTLDFYGMMGTPGMHSLSNQTPYSLLGQRLSLGLSFYYDEVDDPYITNSNACGHGFNPGTSSTFNRSDSLHGHDIINLGNGLIVQDTPLAFIAGCADLDGIFSLAYSNVYPSFFQRFLKTQSEQVAVISFSE
jgi:hypothetical protein